MTAEAVDRAKAGAPGNEIEITPEMIRRGAALIIEFEKDWPPKLLAEKVFREMATVAAAQNCPGIGQLSAIGAHS